MRVLELSLRNYRVFEEVDLELPARVIGIFGPNGAGKSTLVEAIQFACYGRARTDKKQIRTDGVLTDCAVRLVFEHGGTQYEVRRTIRGRNHQTEAELYVADRQLAAGVTEVDQEIQRLLRMDVHVFRASVFAEQKQLDAFSDVTKAKRKEMVLRLLGIRPVDDARTAARREGRDARAAADRLGGALPDADEQQAALQEARASSDEADAVADRAGQALAYADERSALAEEAFEGSDRVRQEVEKLRLERGALSEHTERLQARRMELEDRVAGIEAAVSDLPRLEEEDAALSDAPTRLAEGRRAVDAAAEVEEAVRRLEATPEADVQAALDELEAARKKLDDAQRAQAQAESGRDRALEELAAAEAAVERADRADPSQPCPTCGRPLGEDFEQYLAHCRHAVADGRRKVERTGTALERATEAVNAAGLRFTEATTRGEGVRRAVEDRARLSSSIAALRERLDELTAPFDGKVPDLDTLVALAGRADEVRSRLVEVRAERKHLDAARRDLAGTLEELERSGARLEELGREEAALAFDPEDHARVEKERGEARRLLDQAREEERAAVERARAAKARVTELEAEIRQVEDIRSKVADLLVDARYLDRVSTLLEGFRTYLYGRIVPELSREADALFRELTGHRYDDLRIDPDTLAIEIADGERYFPIERFSGSESDLANLALRVAISTHVSRVSGADLGIMILDEVLASLDVERKDMFVQTMGRLAGRFHQLFVITHAEQVKDQFPVSIEVRSVGRRRSEAVLL
jgi:DNA repair protein SbcC/Rad50